ncbi:MFS transporter [Aquabacterium soli]|uniref:MFS transporter n=1 Tax=Aquabacterium soli TaxID=2493092 RepID=UPI00131540D7|nr:MFS transporter [Aquabacterium soli]
MNEQAPHQFHLLGERRYAPFFWAVFLGSVNDNLLKFAVTLLLVYQAGSTAQPAWLTAGVVGPLTGALFIIPSLLMSAMVGRLADRLPLDRLIRWGKALEVLMMVLAAGAWLAGHAWGLLGCLVLSGMHVTWFSTLKYAYVPQHLGPQELLGGNGLLEMGLFMAILLGTLAGGALMSSGDALPWLPAGLLVLALAGWALSLQVPPTPVAQASMAAVNETGLWRSLAPHGSGPGPWMPVLGISWMWFFGATCLTLFPVVTHGVLQADPSVASLLLVLTSVGIGLGALSCERLARLLRTPGALVALGAIGMAVFGADLAWSLDQIASRGAGPHRLSVLAFLADTGHARLMIDLVAMACSLGWFSVPLYAQMQGRAAPTHRARVVAANNILNAGFILASSALVWGLDAVGLGAAATLATVVGLHTTVMLLVWLSGAGQRSA